MTDTFARRIWNTVSFAWPRKHRRDRRTIARYLALPGLKRLQLGAGAHWLEGWLNSDIRPQRDDVVVFDLTEPFPLPAAAFDYVFAEHVIEHLDYISGKAMLVEVARILKPGGILRLSTPDFAFLADLRQTQLSPLQRDYVAWSTREYLPAGSAVQPQLVINNFVRDWGHQCIYDSALLEDLLTACGFVPARVEVGESEDPNLRGIDNQQRLPDGFLALESMVYEASKANGITTTSRAGR